MTQKTRRDIAANRLGLARSGILDIAGTGDRAISSMLSSEMKAYRQALKQRLAAERGGTYTYRNPNNIPGNPNDPNGIRINMGRRGAGGGNLPGRGGGLLDWLAGKISKDDE